MGGDQEPAGAAAPAPPPGYPKRLTGRGLALAWAAAAVVLGGGLLIEQATRNGMDAANPIRERIGMASYDSFPAPDVAGTVDGERTAVLFVRPEQADSVCTWASGGHVQDVTMVVVAPQNTDCKGVPLTVDADRKIADGFGMRKPKDGGYPVGFALLDSDGGLRYTTLARDYEKRNWWDRHLYAADRWEMQTVLKEIS
jgi:hypothetical protein